MSVDENWSTVELLRNVLHDLETTASTEAFSQEQCADLIDSLAEDVISLTTDEWLISEMGHLIWFVAHFRSLNFAKTASNDSGYGINEDNRGKRDSLDCFATDRKNAIEATIVKPGANRLGFKDVAGLEEAKQALREALVDPVTYPQWFNAPGAGGRQPWRCVLLYGPPGTGKSRLAEALAAEVDSVFYRLSSADLVSSWTGQSEKLVRELFSRRDAAAVVFVDEIDSLCRQRVTSEDDGTRRIKTELLVQLQRIQAEETGGNTFVLGATNCPWDLDPAFLRRFQKRIYVALPCHAARMHILKLQLKGVEQEDMDWQALAELTEGLSGNDLRCLAQEVLYQPIREMRSATHWNLHSHGYFQPAEPSDPEAIQSEMTKLPAHRLRPRPLRQADFDAAIKTTTKTVTDTLLRRFAEFTESFGMNA